MTDDAESEILKDLNDAQRRAQKATYLEAKNEFAENTYPLMIAMFEEMNERLQSTEGALAELIDQQGSYLQPDIASQILTTIEVGRGLVGEVRAAMAVATMPDDVRKRLDDACNLFGAHAEATAVGVSEIVAEGDDSEPEDDDDEDDEGGEDEDDAAEGGQ